MSAPPRPARLTSACIFLGLASLLLSFSSYTGLTNVTSIDTRESVTKALSSEPLNDFHVSVETAIDALRWALTVGVILAACAVIFAIYTWRGHRPSRVIVTIWAGVAALFFLATGLWGILPAAFCVYCAVNLWTGDARHWFVAVNGGGTEGAENDDSGFGHGAGAPAQNELSTPPNGDPENSGQHENSPHGQVAVADSTMRGQRDAHVGHGRPQGILVSAVVTLVASVPVLIVCGINAVWLATARTSYIEQLNDSKLLRDMLDQIDMSAATLASLTAVFCSVASIAALGAVIATVGLLMRQRWGLWLLRVLCVVTIPIAVLGVLFGLIWMAAAIVVLVLLSRPGASAWFKT